MSDSVTFLVVEKWITVGTTASYELDGNEHAGSNNMDSRSLKIDTNGMGVITFSGHGGSQQWVLLTM